MTGGWTSVFAAAALSAAPAVAMAAEGTSGGSADTWPLVILGVGIATVLGLIIGLRVNAFLALILAALVVSMMVPGDAGARMEAVVSAFGDAAGGIGIVIAMAAIIGKCMLDSGAADRIVRWAVNLVGRRHAATGLMGSGFVLAIPVFFDTVFYLLVPLARSLFRRTGTNYLKYLMAIGTGGAITHTLVPPTPGPLLVGANLGVDVGMMMLVGTLVAIPSAIVGLLFSVLVDRWMPVPMRPLGPGQEKHEPLSDEQLPSMWLALLPVVLPVALIGAGTVATTVADREDKARLVAADFSDLEAFRSTVREQAANAGVTPGDRIAANLSEEGRDLLAQPGSLEPDEQQRFVAAMNEVLLERDLYLEEAFQGIPLSEVASSLLAADQLRMKPVDRRRMNRAVLENAYPTLISEHRWDSPSRQWADRLALPSNPNFALLLAAIAAIATLWSVRRQSLRELSLEVEEALMSGGVIILITAAGGAFGGMLKDAQVGSSVQGLFGGTSGGGGGIALLLLAFAISAVLKIAQGSSTVAMIVGSGMVASIAGAQELGFHPVYLGTAVGSGSLIGSWMNDSGFWVFAKMGGLTESEALKSWTLLLLVLGISGLAVTVLLSQVMPLI